jgi:hypothetical protein
MNRGSNSTAGQKAWCTAMPGLLCLSIYVNLALHGTERVAEEVSFGLQRQARERAGAMRAAADELRNHLRGEVTAILLNAELALREKALSASTAEKLTTISEMADSMRRKLECDQAAFKKITPKMKTVRRQALAAESH